MKKAIGYYIAKIAKYIAKLVKYLPVRRKQSVFLFLAFTFMTASVLAADKRADGSNGWYASGTIGPAWLTMAAIPITASRSAVRLAKGSPARFEASSMSAIRKPNSATIPTSTR